MEDRPGDHTGIGTAMTSNPNHNAYSDEWLREILTSVKTIAIIGVSANAARPSHIVLGYLKQRGYDVCGVNPGLAGQTLLGAPCYATLADVPKPVDMVDIFRNSEAALQITREALALTPLPKVIWMQLSVRNDEAAALAEAAGVKVVMNRCPKIEIGRLSGDIGWLGVNTGVMSSKPLRPING